MDPSAPSYIIDIIKELKYRNHICVNLEIEGNSHLDKNNIYKKSLFMSSYIYSNYLDSYSKAI